MSINQNKEFLYTKLAFQQAEINLGSTDSNPSVGCIVVKNNSVISSGHTSKNGRPHAESNALKKKLDYKNSDLYVTLEPCSHYGKTQPCIKKIINKKIKRVIFSINDNDIRSKNKAQKNLKKKNITVKKFILKKFAKNFYKSYFLQASNRLPLIDAKLAVSKDFFTINKKKKWVTNIKSRNLGNFIRSKYDCLITTSKTINYDNPLLNCRVEGLEQKTPTLIVLDRYFRIKKNVKIFKTKKRKIYIFTNVNNNLKKKYLQKKGVKIIRIKDGGNNPSTIFLNIKKLGYNRVFVETGSTFLNQLLKLKIVSNLYLFKSSKKLFSYGKNNSSLSHIKKLKTTKANEVKVNLDGDILHKVEL